MALSWKNILQDLDDLVSLVYPRLCPSCGSSLLRNERFICLPCRYELPETNYHCDPENRVARHFWGRVPLSGAASLYTFATGSNVQKLIHALKYENKPEIGEVLGMYYGLQLKSAPPFMHANLIVPVPLHPRKEHKRGYNQAARFANGLSQGMGIKAAKHILKRVNFTETQTRKNRMERWENVRSVFQLGERLFRPDCHILLVDDVVTTGATLEACARTLLEAGCREVSVATIACAAHL